LGLNYTGLVAPIVRAIQALSAEITSMENTIAGFAESFTTKELTFTRATGDQMDVQKLCVTDGPTDQSPVCITKAQLSALLSQSASAGLANPSPIGASSTSSQSNAPSTTSDTTPPAVSAVEPPVVHINGDNPAIIHVGDTYSDLGATITGPQADLNLGISTYVNGTAISPVEISTTGAATDTISYVVTDQSGLTATSTRTVIVEQVATQNAADAGTGVATSSSSGPAPNSTAPAVLSTTTASTTTPQ
jgi:hypothetical protein